MLIKKPALFLLGSCLLIMLFIVVFAPGAAASDSLKKLLPAVSVLGEVTSLGESQEATGDALFELINGGAVIFFKHGFKRAMFQEYALKDGKTVHLEIYQMGSPEGAEGIYLEKKGEGGEKLDFGSDGILLDYYCMLWQGSYYITVSGGASTEDARKSITAIARFVVDNISPLSK